MGPLSEKLTTADEAMNKAESSGKAMGTSLEDVGATVTDATDDIESLT